MWDNSKLKHSCKHKFQLSVYRKQIEELFCKSYFFGDFMQLIICMHSCWETSHTAQPEKKINQSKPRVLRASVSRSGSEGASSWRQRAARRGDGRVWVSGPSGLGSARSEQKRS